MHFDIIGFIAEYPEHLKPDVYVIYESAYLNIIVYIIGTLTILLLIGKYMYLFNNNIDKVGAKQS